MPHFGAFTVVACVAVTALVGFSVSGLEWVRGGKPVASIIVPAEPLPVESYAAKELQYHVESATGAQLPIISENREIPAGAHVFLGHCKAAKAAKVDLSGLRSEERRVGKECRSRWSPY